MKPIVIIIIVAIVFSLGLTFVPTYALIGTNGQITFVSDRDGNDEIYVMNADGSGQTNISNNSAKEATPSWSPDGTQIAFVSDRTGTDNIYIMNADGSGVTQVTSGTIATLSPDWSPDGTKLVYTKSSGGETLFIINTDGTGDTKLTSDTFDDDKASWSPDGTKIVFEKFVTEGEDDPGEIYVIDIDGTNEVNLTSGQDVLNPSWSSDGLKIFFDKKSTTNREIFVMNADGTNQVQLTDNSLKDDDPSASPNGSQIVFERSLNEIFVMNADGTNQVQLTDNSVLDFDPDWGMSCSPPDSGTWIVTVSCTLSSTATASGNVVIQNNSVLTIPDGLTLNIDFTNFSLTIKSGSGVLIKSGGTIT